MHPLSTVNAPTQYSECTHSVQWMHPLSTVNAPTQYSECTHLVQWMLLLSAVNASTVDVFIPDQPDSRADAAVAE